MPYIGEKLCNQGWVQQLTIALLVSQGYEIIAKFLPWARTISDAETGQADILYPEYYIEKNAPSDVIQGTKRLDHLTMSKEIPGGPIVFMKRINDPDKFKGNLFNLKGEKIGVVRGYQNTPEFDALMDSGFFNISEAVDDLMNVKKLYNQRINLIIGDAAVIYYSLLTSDIPQPKKSLMIQGIEVVKPMIQYNHLYYAVSKKRPGWQKTLKDLNHAISVFESNGLMLEIIQSTIEECSIKLNDIYFPYQKNEP
jgi:polar amino acid transport system substrate-binding protein